MRWHLDESCLTFLVQLEILDTFKFSLRPLNASLNFKKQPKKI